MALPLVMTRETMFAVGSRVNDIRWRLITTSLLVAILVGLLAFTVSLLADYYFEPSTQGAVSSCQFELMTHFPKNGPIKWGWVCDSEPLSLQHWFLTWLQSAKAARAGYIAAFTALLTAWAVFGIDWFRQARIARKAT